jgi:radical SAM protein with 4Fe4S-binding SPASM domain
MDAKTYLTKKSFCTLPWTGVYIQPDGDVRNCAITKTTIGNINKQPLEDILRGSVNQTIKQDMLNDVMHERCGQCHRLESHQKNHFDQVSNRVWYLKKLKTTDMTVFDDPENFQLKMLDLRWKNTCNFACVYCDPSLSSRWAVELGQPQRIESEALAGSLDYIYNNLHTVDHIYLAGGEPLLIRENLVLLTKMLDINPDIELRINTNLSVIDNDIYNLIKQFSNVHWTVSVDNIGDQFEYLRYGSNWPQFLNNLQQLNKDFDKINFNAVWCVLNSKSVFEFIDYFIDLGYHENTFIVNPLEYPDWLDINNLPETQLADIRKELESRIEHTDPHFCLNNSLRLMLNFISNSNFNKDLDETVANLATIDLRRNFNSKNLFPELYTCSK